MSQGNSQSSNATALLGNEVEESRPIRISNATRVLARIDSEAPMLTYFGLAFWIAWNSIAFSGTAWLYDQEFSFLVEELMCWHFGTCVLVSLALALTSRWSMHVIADNRFTFAGAFVACLGTVLIVATRNVLSAVAVYLFPAGCILTGIGTTVLFMRSVPLLGALPPRRVLIVLAGCELLGCAVFFMVSSCPEGLDGVVFIALPLLSAAFYALRSTDRYGEEQVLHEQKPFRWTFAVFVASIAFCGAGFDLIRSYLLINLPPADSALFTVYQNVAVVALMSLIGAAALASSPTSIDGSKRLYSITVGSLAVLLAMLVVFAPYAPAAAIISKTVQAVFNFTVRAMLAYIVYQSKSNALTVFGYGNCGLCFGTWLICIISLQYFHSNLSDENIRLLLGLLCVCVIAIVVLVFSEKQLNRLLLPIEETRLEPGETVTADDADVDFAADEKADRKGEWMRRCEQIADKHGLSPREQVVFISLAKGRSPQQIAERESVSIHTIRSQIRSIHIKMDVHSKSELSKLIEREMKDFG